MLMGCDGIARVVLLMLVFNIFWKTSWSLPFNFPTKLSSFMPSSSCLTLFLCKAHLHLPTR
uniref:Putative ovule protein n=1 Tax=Solanum chacoense TaxID=4108 RepID=A0A0V0GQB4_SOLCH